MEQEPITEILQLIEQEEVEPTPFDIIQQRIAKREKISINGLATPNDYKEKQGGIPTIYELPKQTIIIYDYPEGNGAIVDSHKTVEEYGTVRHKTQSGDIKLFACALLWEHHGQPCENQSQQGAGGIYKRIK